MKTLLNSGIDNFSLVGGAVYGTVVDGEVKDYDLFGIKPALLADKGFHFQYETELSTTFTKDGDTFQILKTDIKDFDFTIAAIEFRAATNPRYFKIENRSTFFYLDGDLLNLSNKNLVPVHSNSFRNRINQLARISHYENKGFSLNPITYQSLVRETFRCGNSKGETITPTES